MLGKGKARTGADKLARRLDIIEAALDLWQSTPYDKLTMSQVATKVNLGKGTLYLYFPSKEELFLAVYIGLMDEWFDRVERGLVETHSASVKKLAELMVDGLLRKPNLARLIPLVAGSLEQNLQPETAKAYKYWLAKRIDRLGGEIEERVPGLPPGSGPDALLYFQALAAGLGPMGDPGVAMRDLLQEQGLIKLRVEFGAALREGIEAVLVGFQHRFV